MSAANSNMSSVTEPVRSTGFAVAANLGSTPSSFSFWNFCSVSSEKRSTVKPLLSHSSTAIMRSCSACACGASSRFEGDNGLLQCYFFGYFKEFTSMLDVLNVEQYNASFLIIQKVMHHFRLGYVALVAETYEFADADLASSQVVQCGNAEGSTLRNYGDVSRHRSRCGDYLVACCQDFGFGKKQRVH